MQRVLAMVVTGLMAWSGPPAWGWQEEGAADATKAPAAAELTPAERNRLRAEAQKQLDEVFGKEIRDAKSTATATDDLLLGRKLLDASKNYENKPILVGLICENVFALSQRDPLGYETAVEAMQVWAKADPREADNALNNITQLRRKAYATAKREEKEGAGGQLIAALVAQADLRASRSEYNGALGVLRQAVTVATAIKSDEKEDLNTRIERLGALMRVERQAEALKTRIKADAPDREAAATELLMLYVEELDDPALASSYAFLSMDMALTKRIKLAEGDPGNLTAEEAMELAEWYRQIAEKSKPGFSKAAMTTRARNYYDQYVQKQTGDELLAAKAKLMVEKLDGELSKMDTRGVASGRRWVNVLSKINPAVHGVLGDWKSVNGELRVTTDRGKTSLIGMPVKPVGDYEVQVKFNRSDQSALVGVTFPVGEKQASLILRRNDPNLKMGASGLYFSNSELVKPTEAGFKVKFADANQDQTMNVAVKVRGENAEVVATVDGQEYVKWKGKWETLGAWPTEHFARGRPMALLAGTGNVTIKVVRISARKEDLKEYKPEDKQNGPGNPGAGGPLADLVDPADLPELQRKLAAMPQREREEIVRRFILAGTEERKRIVKEVLGR